jgi:hypothetical protein
MSDRYLALKIQRGCGWCTGCAGNTVKITFPTYHFLFWTVTRVTDSDTPEEILSALNILACLRDPQKSFILFFYQFC